MKSLKTSVLATMAALLVSTPAWATTITYATPAGSTTSGGAVSATATFTTGAGTLMVVASNLLTNAQVIDVAQNISGIFFTLSTGQTVGTLLSTTSAAEDVNSGVGVNHATVVSNGWAVSSGFELCDLCSSAAGPSETIIGGSPGAYANANGSIDGNKPHNPFLDGPVTFQLTIPGVTALSTITAVTFQFGTTEGSNRVIPVCTTGCTSELPPPPTVPEPRSLLLLGTGLVFGAALLRRRFAL